MLIVFLCGGSFVVVLSENHWSGCPVLDVFRSDSDSWALVADMGDSSRPQAAVFVASSLPGCVMHL